MDGHTYDSTSASHALPSKSGSAPSKRWCLDLVSDALNELDSAEENQLQAFDPEAAEALFGHYHAMCPAPAEQPRFPEETGSRFISGQGLEAVKSDIGWCDRCTPGVTAFFFILRTRYIGLVSEAEWMRGFSLLNCSTLADARHRCLLLHHQIVQEKEVYQQYMAHSFHFFKDPGSRVISRALAQKLLIVVAGGSSVFTHSFSHYLAQAEVPCVNFDQWQNFLPFSTEVDEACTTYSCTDAWPTLYDEYVTWRRGNTSPPLGGGGAGGGGGVGVGVGVGGTDMSNKRQRREAFA
eukprot:TRINITY_DN31634_c0_g1_i1.p1 TRINITY_DN31634_c0_g1~~TRINITY_DN31634_c0_g1_i1.p1  ORF type:complete len:340 (+),score=63.68 TRINITY_DN31634_c0_g1_i1:141-1022(+)